jgi:uncharacterized protein with FMN-binding domain
VKIHFKKIMVSILVIAGFVLYAVYQRFNINGLNIANNQQTTTEKISNTSESQTTAASSSTTQANITNNDGSGVISGDDEDEEFENTASSGTSSNSDNATTTSTTATSSTSTSTTTSTTVASGLYKDGQYDGAAADAYYGFVQVRAIIQDGKLIDVQFLSYPSDRSHSVEINNYAMPILKSEAIKAQSVQVNIVSGATNTSRAFIESLSSALNQAKV